MHLWPHAVAVGLVVLAGCSGPAPEPDRPRPAGDTGTPADEFRMAHEAFTRLNGRMDELRAAADPNQALSTQFPEAVPLTRALSAAQRQAGRLGYEVGMADPTGPLGADALYACLLHSFDPMDRRRTALDLAVRHHPNDPRLGQYLFALLGDRVPDGVRRWADPVIDRVLVSSTHPAVLAAARVSRGRLLLTSPDPAAVAAGERLLEAAVRQYPDETVGSVRVAAWADGVLAEHNRYRGGLGSPTVRLRS